MSQENVEQLYRAYDAFNRRDLDAYLARIDPEVEFTPRIMGLEGGFYRGQRDGVRESVADPLSSSSPTSLPRSWKFATLASP